MLVKEPRYATVASRVENRATLVPLLNQVLGTRPAEDWMKRLEAVGVPAGRIRTVPEVCESEHLRARRSSPGGRIVRPPPLPPWIRSVAAAERITSSTPWCAAATR